MTIDDCEMSDHEDCLNGEIHLGHVKIDVFDQFHSYYYSQAKFLCLYHVGDPFVQLLYGGF